MGSGSSSAPSPPDGSGGTVSAVVRRGTRDTTVVSMAVWTRWCCIGITYELTVVRDRVRSGAELIWCGVCVHLVSPPTLLVLILRLT